MWCLATILCERWACSTARTELVICIDFHVLIPGITCGVLWCVCVCVCVCVYAMCTVRRLQRRRSVDYTRRSSVCFCVYVLREGEGDPWSRGGIWTRKKMGDGRENGRRGAKGGEYN
jgi:hypothetical protein